jgi:hypothetical protein
MYQSQMRIPFHEFRLPAFYAGLLPDLVKVVPYRRHVWDDIRLETIREPGVVEPNVKEGAFGRGRGAPG